MFILKCYIKISQLPFVEACQSFLIFKLNNFKLKEKKKMAFVEAKARLEQTSEPSVSFNNFSKIQ